MSARWRKKHPKLELELHLSPPRASCSSNKVACGQPLVENPLTDPAPSPSSCDSSCLSSTADYDNPRGDDAQVTLETSPLSMVVLGCPRCLMYVMLSEVEPRCPRCKSTALLDLHDVDLNSQKNKKMKTT